MSFLDFGFSSSWEREKRESGIQNIRYKGETSPKLLILFYPRGSTGESFFFHGLIDFVLFFFTGLKNLGSPRVSVILLSSTRSKMAIVRLPRALRKKLTFLTIYFRWPEGGGESPLPFWGPSQSFGFSPPSPSGVRRPEVTKYQHLVTTPLWDPHSLLTVTCLTARYC